MTISGSGISEGGSIPDDLVAIYQGGQYFLDRMKSFESAKANASSALEQLQLGQEAVAAKAAAEAKMAEASDLHQQASAHLDDVRAQAADHLSNIMKEADAIIAAANQKAAAIVGEAEKLKAEAEAYVSRIKSEVERLFKEAKDRIEGVNAKEAEANARTDAADAAIKAAEVAKAQHDFMADAFQKKVEALKAVMA